MAEMSDDQDFPRNFDFAVKAASAEANTWYFSKGDKHSNDNLTVDQKMLLQYPEQYSDGVPGPPENGKMVISAYPSTIAVFFQWTNVYGPKEEFGEKEIEWFEKIRDRTVRGQPGSCTGLEVREVDGWEGPTDTVYKKLVLKTSIL